MTNSESTITSELRVDVAVIGAGTAGLAAYRAAKAAGARALIIEGGPYGTTCARVGCMPSKLLIAPAEAAHAVDRFPGFGLTLEGPVHVDGKAVMERVRSERDRFVGFVTRGVDEIPDGDKVRGYARFVDNNTLAVDGGITVHAKSIVIATGSSTAYPDGMEGARRPTDHQRRSIRTPRPSRKRRRVRPGRHRPGTRPGAASAGRARQGIRTRRRRGSAFRSGACARSQGDFRRGVLPRHRRACGSGPRR